MNIGILILMIIGGGVGVLSSLYIALSFRQSLSGRSTGKSAMDISLHISYMNYYFMTVFRSCSISSISDRISSCCLSNNNFLLY